MIDDDISAADALRLLSAQALDSNVINGWSRRKFLQAVGLGVGAGLSLGSLGQELLGHEIPEAWAGSPIGATDGILVNIVFFGGNDGLNTVVPYTNGEYYQWRKGTTSIAPASVLQLDGTFGLHPSLPYIKALWDTGQVAVVHGLGYNPPNLSHFSSMAIWMNGHFGAGAGGTGWLGRWLDGQPAATAQFAAATVGSSVPLHLIGASRRALGIPESGGMLGSDTNPRMMRAWMGLSAMANASGGRGPWHDAYASTMRTTISVAGELSPAFNPPLTGSEFVKKLTMAARLINRNIGLRVVDVGVGGFDTHDGEPWRHAALLKDFNDGVQNFFATLDASFRSRVTMMTMSEFGRTVQGNDSQGTDHGTANTHFVIGNNVRGGMYGQPASLVVKNQWDRLVAAVDFRSLYGSVIDGWMGGGASTILNGSFENLNLFASSPGGAPKDVPNLPISIPSAPSTFTPMSPLRLFDTRDGTGGRLGALTSGETWAFPIAGQYGVPADAVAVALNVTSVEATAPTFITVWAAGTARPFTSNLNPVPGMAVPNLVIGRIGSNGACSMYNLSGQVHLVADLVGYFKAGSSVGLVPLTPRRLLDTRDGTGGRLGKIVAGENVDVVVSGRGGVSAKATAVLLNVTATEPTAASFLTVYPTAEPLPLASSVNMIAGQTVPNMVIARVGKDGQVGIFNKFGATHVVVDVLGCFVPGATGQFVAVGPTRLLDTRDGTGLTAAGRVGQAPLSVRVRGTAGVPDNASAVMVNVTAVEPTAATYVTVFPGGETRPLASNLNVLPGQIIPNMVLGRIGNDGALQIANYAGTVDIVADVVGYSTS